MEARRDGDAVLRWEAGVFAVRAASGHRRELHAAGGCCWIDDEMWRVCDNSNGELRREVATCNPWRWRLPRGAQALCGKAAGWGRLAECGDSLWEEA